VIKEIRVEGMTQAERDEAVYEARIMAALKHTNIVQLVDPPWYVIVHRHCIYVTVSIRHRLWFAAFFGRSSSLEPWDGLETPPCLFRPF
jgi:hypothetical protein